MATEMLSFYRNKVVLLTGGTGFLGKVLLEKLLRATEVKCIFLLIREKRGRSVNERIEDIFKDPLFATLLKSSPEVKHNQRVVPINGDCALPDLGLSSADATKLIQTVDIVLHNAATVRFNEPLSVAVATNVRATIDLIKLAKQMENLKAFLHVSSAYSNCTEMHIEERFYPEKVGISATEICSMLGDAGAERLNSMDETLRGGFPNTYCFSKALAEEALLTQASDLPVCIFRPGIVISTYKEPVPGWIDNIYGPTGIFMATAYGLLHVVYIRRDSKTTFVPVDFCANAMLACVWQTSAAASKASPSTTASIFNLVPAPDNTLKWREYQRLLEVSGPTMPLTSMIWYPFLINTSSKLMYTLLIFCLHTLPGYIMDLGLLLVGRKPRMTEVYSKVHKQIGAMHYFMLNEWTFDMRNTRALWKALSEQDQQLFPFDMSSINWAECFHSNFWGMRLYLAKEDPASIPKGVKLYKLYRILHWTLQILLSGGVLYLLMRTVKRVVN